MSEFYVLVQVAVWFARWVVRTVYVLMMLVVHMDMVVNKRFVKMKMGMSFGYEKQNTNCHGT